MSNITPDEAARLREANEAARLADEAAAAAEMREARSRREGFAARRTLLAESGLFDAEWYRARTPGAAESDLDPLDHYLFHGVPAGAPPGPLFDATHYLRMNWHLERGVDDPLAHFLQHAAEGSWARSLMEPPSDPQARRVEPLLLLPRPPQAGPQRMRLAVVVHVFYPELFGEICRALRMLPERFSLLVTTDTEEKAEQLTEEVAGAGLEANLVLRVCPNRGRNFGPMLLQFRDVLLQHDLMLHLHTKRSLYSGADQVSWRQGLLRGLLPARAVVNGLLARFAAEPRLGVLVPAPGEAVRYWSWNWLSNRDVARTLYERLGLRGEPGEAPFDYPVGGMFWARPAALEPLLAADWREGDFPQETGQTDGTMMHAIERVIVTVARETGFEFGEIDAPHGLLRPGWSARNAWQYGRASHDALLDTIGQVRCVSFDVFDTLLMRQCLTPDALHRYLDFVVARRFPGAVGYRQRRLSAEAALRRERGGAGDVGLDEIHARFRTHVLADAESGWSRAAIAFVEKEEVALDGRLLLPRRIMMEALDRAHSMGRRVVLTSDSYLTRPMFDSLLARHGLSGKIEAVYLSSERRARKDRGDLWPIVQAAESDGPLLHVGDNEQSDIQKTADAGIRHFHVMKASSLFALHELAPPAPEGERPLGDEILLGPVAARLFNSPYLAPDADRPLSIDSPEQMGAVLFGPILFAFIAWIVRNPAVRHLDTLFFVAREGYFLRRLYDRLRTDAGREDLPPARYFHCSRRAALAALQGRGLDVDSVLSGAGYHGSLTGLLEARLGFTPDPSFGHDHSAILLPRDNDLVRCAMELMEPAITAHGRLARQGLSAYAESRGMRRGVRAGFVDVGYSGTIQAALQTVLGRPLVGLYMGVSNNAAQVRAGGGYAFGAFADGNIADFTGTNGLMLEAFLTAPHGQVGGYDISADPPIPVFRQSGLSQRQFPLLERVYAGAEEYATTLIRCYGPEVLELDYRPEAAQAMLKALREGRIGLSTTLQELLSVEDAFCGNGEIPVFEWLVPTRRGAPTGDRRARAETEVKSTD